MDIEDFVGRLESEFDELPRGTLRPDTGYRDIPGWSSMHVLILMALLDTEYGVSITGEELRDCQTIADLFEHIQTTRK